MIYLINTQRGRSIEEINFEFGAEDTSIKSNKLLVSQILIQSKLEKDQRTKHHKHTD
jgi:hypothetical protein